MQENTTETVVKGARSTFWIMFFFMLLHQADKLLIGPLTTQIMDSFKSATPRWERLQQAH